MELWNIESIEDYASYRSQIGETASVTYKGFTLLLAKSATSIGVAREDATDAQDWKLSIYRPRSEKAALGPGLVAVKATRLHVLGSPKVIRGIVRVDEWQTVTELGGSVRAALDFLVRAKPHRHSLDH